MMEGIHFCFRLCGLQAGGSGRVGFLGWAAVGSFPAFLSLPLCPCKTAVDPVPFMDLLTSHVSAIPT